jgi:hypothetical protein
MKTQHALLNFGAALLAASTLVFGQQPVTTPANSPGSAPPPGAGWFNDWLRTNGNAWKSWDLGGQFRFRFEDKEHMAIAGVTGAMDFRDHGADHSNAYELFRTKLHLGYKAADWLGVYAEGRDSVSWNDDRVPEPEEDRFDFHQGYILLGDPKQFPVTVKVGRQELAYGDERLVGPSDWNNLGRVFDAARLRFENPAFWAEGFAGRVVVPRDDQFNMPNDYDWFWGAYSSTRKLCPRQETQLYFLGRNASAESPAAVTGGLVGLATPRDVYTIGLRAKSLPGQPQGFDYSLELAGQSGRFQETASSPSLDHQAFAAHAATGYTWEKAALKPRLGVEYNFASGDSNPNDNQHETFENLFPTNHKFYGFMDFFSWQNLHDVRFSALAKPASGLQVSLDYHLFWLADTADYFYQVSGAPRTGAVVGSGEGYNRNPAYDSFVGSELDLVASYAVKPWASLQAGYGHFFVGSYVKQSLSATTHGATDADWVYVQATLNF